MQKYNIKGEELQFLEVELQPGESIISESGTLLFMEDGIKMEPIIGDGSEGKGLFGSLLDVGKRALTGESLFLTQYQNTSSSPKSIGIGSPRPGKIIPINLSEINGSILAQKGSFLCSNKGVKLSVALTKRMGAGLFGGEGFILQKLSGSNNVFIHAGGAIIERTLKPGELLRVETGNLVAFTDSVEFNAEMVSFKNQLFGGTGLFVSTLRGPGKIWIQSHQHSKMVDEIAAYIFSNIKK